MPEPPCPSKTARGLALTRPPVHAARYSPRRSVSFCIVLVQKITIVVNAHAGGALKTERRRSSRPFLFRCGMGCLSPFKSMRIQGANNERPLRRKCSGVRPRCWPTDQTDYLHTPPREKRAPQFSDWPIDMGGWMIQHVRAFSSKVNWPQPLSGNIFVHRKTAKPSRAAPTAHGKPAAPSTIATPPGSQSGQTKARPNNTETAEPD